MPKSDLDIRRGSGLLAAIKGDPTATEAAAIQKAAFLARVTRSAERDLSLLEMGDVEALMMRGIGAAGNAASQAVAEVEANPHAALGVGRLLNTGNIGLDQILRRYTQGD